MVDHPNLMTPPAAAEGFLAGNGWAGAKISPLAGDASFRRYFRVNLGERRAVLMDAPPLHEDPRPFVAMAEYLCDQGFCAPAILASDLDTGLLLLDDLGDARMKEVIEADSARETEIYATATDLLIDLHKRAPAPIKPYDLNEYHREVDLFPTWYVPAVGLSVDMDGYHRAWAAALAPIVSHQTVTVLRDYHAENIMMISGKSGVAGLGLLDFQDALVGHPAYDLVSLLQDARRDVSPALEAAMMARYQATAPLDPAHYALLGAQRNVKILGIFARLWKRDGKPRYLQYQARVWGYLERDLAHPTLAPVQSWFAANVPTSLRAAFDYGVSA